MALELHTLYAANLNSALLDGITDFSLDTQTAEVLRGADGIVDPTFVAVMGQAPRISITTMKLATALAAIGISGAAIASNADFYFQKITEGGTRAGASSHILLRVAEGLIVPRTLTAPHDGEATLTYDTICTYDGSNNPIVITTSQSLTGSPAVSEVYVAGKVMINGAQLEGVQNITIDFGIGEIVRGADGAVWPTFAAIMTRQPSITITTLDAAALNTFGLTGAAQGGTDSLVYLRKVAEGGTRVAEATAQHISFSIDEGRVGAQTVTGPHGEPLGTAVKITPTWDGTAAIFVINTATAIA